MAGIPLQKEIQRKSLRSNFIEKLSPSAGLLLRLPRRWRKQGDFVLDGFKSTAELLQNQHVWLRIWENLRTQIMPPAKEEFQPSVRERKEMIAWIEQRIFALDPKNPDPGALPFAE
jgi:hypothetical protein